MGNYRDAAQILYDRELKLYGHLTEKCPTLYDEISSKIRSIIASQAAS